MSWLLAFLFLNSLIADAASNLILYPFCEAAALPGTKIAKEVKFVRLGETLRRKLRVVNAVVLQEQALEDGTGGASLILRATATRSLLGRALVPFTRTELRQVDLSFGEYQAYLAERQDLGSLQMVVSAEPRIVLPRGVDPANVEPSYRWTGYVRGDVLFANGRYLVVRSVLRGTYSEQGGSTHWGIQGLRTGETVEYDVIVFNSRPDPQGQPRLERRALSIGGFMPAMFDGENVSRSLYRVGRVELGNEDEVLTAVSDLPASPDNVELRWTSFFSVTNFRPN